MTTLKGVPAGRREGPGGSYHVGSAHPGAKINEDIVRAIRRDAKATPKPTLKALADKYGVSTSCMQTIVSRSRWAHVKEDA